MADVIYPPAFHPEDNVIYLDRVRKDNYWREFEDLIERIEKGGDGE